MALEVAEGSDPDPRFDGFRNGGGSPWPAFELFGHLITEDELVYDQKLYHWPHYAQGHGQTQNVAGLDIQDGLLDTAGRLAGSVGAAPDHPMQPSLEDLRTGADPALQRALELASSPAE